MTLTRREKVIVAVCFTTSFFINTLLTFGIVDQQTIIKWTMGWLWFYVLPLGIYIVTDWDRISQFK